MKIANRIDQRRVRETGAFRADLFRPPEKRRPQEEKGVLSHTAMFIVEVESDDVALVFEPSLVIHILGDEVRANYAASGEKLTHRPPLKRQFTKTRKITNCLPV
jgi:hypothetical protein